LIKRWDTGEIILTDIEQERYEDLASAIKNSGKCFSRADLRWADLQEANLQGANLRWADLQGARKG